MPEIMLSPTIRNVSLLRRKLLCPLLPAWLFLNCSSLLLAQTPPIKFERIPLEEGRTIYSILQDQQGFLWLGTADGLIKYDGYGFTAYRHDAFDSLSLSSNFVYALCEDHTGTLWVGTVGGGLNRFDREREQFTRFVHDPNNPHSLSFNSIGAIHEDHTGALWIGTADLLSEAGAGLNKFDRATQRFIHFVHDSSDVRSLSHNSCGTYSKITPARFGLAPSAG